MNPLAMRPIVFIGGYARSGTKILKKLIERLTQTKCNAETRVITDLFGLLIKWKQNQKEVVRLREAGVDDSVSSLNRKVEGINDFLWSKVLTSRFFSTLLGALLRKSCSARNPQMQLQSASRNL